jgi:hypothetical protein
MNAADQHPALPDVATAPGASGVVRRGTAPTRREDDVASVVWDTALEARMRVLPQV